MKLAAALLLSFFASSPATAQKNPVTALVSWQHNGNVPNQARTWGADASLGATKVVFLSNDNSLVTNDTNPGTDIFLWDNATKKTRIITLSHDRKRIYGSVGRPRIDFSGTTIVFASDDSSLVKNDTNGKWDIFRYDVTTDKISMVSVNDQGKPANGDSVNPDLALSGFRIVFESGATDLIPGGGPQNGPHIYVAEPFSNKTYLLSQDTTGIPADGASENPAISYDGNFVVFASHASNLTPPHPQHTRQIYMKNLTNAATDKGQGPIDLISVNSRNEAADMECDFPRVSAGGKHVVYESMAANLDDNMSLGGLRYVYHRDVAAQKTTGMHANGKYGQGEIHTPSLSFSGQYVAFLTDNPLIAQDMNGNQDVYVKNLKTGRVNLASVDTNGRQYTSGTLEAAEISDGGQYVVFDGTAKPFIGNTITYHSVYLRNRGLQAQIDTISPHCGGSRLTPSELVVGQTATIALDQGASHQSGMLYAGSLLGTPIPLPMIGGCPLSVNPAGALPIGFRTDQQGRWTYRHTIPNNPNVVGLRFAIQALSSDLSNAHELVVGY